MRSIQRYKRCCDRCLKREIECRSGTKTQYYHRLVAFQIIAKDFNFLLDLELVPMSACTSIAAKLVAKKLSKTGCESPRHSASTQNRRRSTNQSTFRSDRP